MCILGITVRDIAKKIICIMMGFGCSEMAEDPMEDTHFNTEEENSSTGSQGISSSQHQSQTQMILTQQQRERMERQKQMALARQRARKQSQGSPSESQAKIGSESGVFYNTPNCRESGDRQKDMRISGDWQEDMRILEDHSDKEYCHGCKPNSEGSITLSKQQLRVLKAVSRGKSVFLTGSAGTGKSYVLDFVVKILKKLHGPNSVFVTASTGIAACHLNGMTLHSFAGAPPCSTSKYTLLAMVRKSKIKVKRWRKARALIIDEISMIDGEFFDQLNYVANELRQPLEGKAVWGGLQLVVTGDFFQLPPVRPQNPNKFFAFQADCWNDCFDKQIELRHVFRQSDRELVEMLQEIRRGLFHPKTLAKLNNCHGPSVNSDDSVTRLYPRNDDVRRVNDERLKALGQEIITFRATDVGEEPAKSQLKSGIAPDQIGLCLGAQVMLTKNLETENGLVNGAIGQIVEFVKDNTYPIAVCQRGLWPKVRFLSRVEKMITPESWSVYEGEKEMATRTQVPLILAWAVTVHKCQGMTLDRLETDLSRAFDYGMVYVALSRVKNLDGLRLTGFNPSKIKAHPKVLDFYQRLTKQK